MSVLSISLDKLMTLSEQDIKDAVVSDLINFLQTDIPESYLDTEFSRLGSGYYVDSVELVEWRAMVNEEAGNITCTGTMRVTADIHGAEDSSTSHPFQGAFECLLLGSGFERVSYSVDTATFKR